MSSASCSVKNYLLFIFQIFSNINKNEGGERLKSHVVVGLSLRSLGSEEQAGAACELRAAVGGCLQRARVPG